VTASGCMRGRKLVPLKAIADGACAVAQHGGVKVPLSLCYVYLDSRVSCMHVVKMPTQVMGEVTALPRDRRPCPATGFLMK
jgi:hypothetical protein